MSRKSGNRFSKKDRREPNPPPLSSIARQPRKSKRPRGAVGALLSHVVDALLERGLHRRERGVQLRAKARHHGDDRDRDTGRNQPVLYGGRTTFVLCKTRENPFHNPELRWPFGERR